MDSRAISAALLVNFLLLSAASAFDITKLLAQIPDFTKFNDLLTQTKVADEINGRSSVTVLALDNGAVSGLSGKPLYVVKRILSVHVLLDYYDVKKLGTLSRDNTTVLTTLFQTSGTATNEQGFIKVTLINLGEVAFASAVKGAPVDSKLVKSVAAQPYNISVLQITSPIQVPGIDFKSANSTPSAPPPKSSSPVGSPKKAPAPSAETPSKAGAPAAKSPKAAAGSPKAAVSPKAAAGPRAAAGSPRAGSPRASAGSPRAGSPRAAAGSPRSAAGSPKASADSPNGGADSPVSSPPMAAADSPNAGDNGEADAGAPGPSDESGASSGSFVGAVAVMAVISSFLAL